MFNSHKGYRVELDEFNKYYRSTSRTDNSAWLRTFANAFRDEMRKEGYPDGLYSDTVNYVEHDIAKLCRNTRVKMISKGCPAASATQVISSFKRWFKSRWA